MEFSSFWMRRSCNESLRFRLIRSFCNCRRLAIVRHIPRVSHYGQKRDNQTDVERRCRRSSRRLHCERI